MFRPKYGITEERVGYRSTMKLIVRKFSPSDVGTYHCVSTNSLGKAEGTLRLYGEWNLQFTLNPQWKWKLENFENFITFGLFPSLVWTSEMLDLVDTFIIWYFYVIHKDEDFRIFEFSEIRNIILWSHFFSDLDLTHWNFRRFSQMQSQLWA